MLFSAGQRDHFIGGPCHGATGAKCCALCGGTCLMGDPSQKMCVAHEHSDGVLLSM